MMHHSRLSQSFCTAFACICFALLCAPLSAQKADEALIGTWIGTSASNRGERVVVARDHVVLAGTRMSLRFVGRGVLQIGMGDESERLSYRIQNDTLTIKDSDDDVTTWRRVAKQPAKKPGDRHGKGARPQGRGDNPLERDVKPQGGNPLDPEPKRSDPFVREFKGDGIGLSLTREAAGYRGTLTFRGKGFPATAKADGKTLRGSFRSGGKDYEFSAVLRGDKLTLKSGRSEYQLVGAPMSSNPLDQGTVRENPLETPHPRVKAGTKLLVNEVAGVACRVPKSWSVLKADQTGCVLNPGFARGQSLDVTVTAHALPLDDKAKKSTAVQLLTSELDSTRKSLEANGIKTAAPTRGVQRMSVGNKEAAFVVMKAEAARRPGMVWCAIRIAGDKCLVINSIFLDGKESDYLPMVKYAFETLTRSSEANKASRDSDTNRGGSRGTPPTPRKGVVFLKRREFRDAGFGGIVSHRMYLPADWRGDGKVQWTNARSNFTQFVGAFSGPGDLSINFDYNRYFANSTLKQTLDQFRMNAAMDRSGYSLIAWPPRQRGETAVRHIIPKLRPRARNLRLIGVKNFPKAEAVLREQLAPILRQLQPGHTMELGVLRAHVGYEEDGREWEEYVIYAIAINKLRMRSQVLNSDTGLTEVSGVHSYRAPRGRLAENFPRMKMIVDSLKPTPRWSISLSQLQMEISKIRHKGRMQAIAAFGKRARIIAQTNSEISDMQMASWRKQQATRDRIQKATVNSILEVHDYKTRGGSPIALDHSYGRVFEDAQGNVIMTNDANYDPSTDPRLKSSDWKKLERIRHIGR